MSKIPIIDIQGLISNDFKSGKDTAREINSACLDSGFFYISNHGVDQDLIDDLMRVSKDFFSLSQVEKEKITIKNSFASRGYEGLFTQALEKGTSGDLKESIYFGRELALDHPDVLARKYGKGPNQWPGDICSCASTTCASTTAASTPGQRRHHSRGCCWGRMRAPPTGRLRIGGVVDHKVDGL